MVVLCGTTATTENMSNTSLNTQREHTLAHGIMRLGTARGGTESAAASAPEERGGEYRSGMTDAREEPDASGWTRQERARNGERNGGAPRTKARLTVAALNIRGYTTRGTDIGACGKWGLVNQLIRDRKIAILAVQEAHLDLERVDSVNRLFGQYMEVWASPDPTNATGARGVAFAINKRLTKNMHREYIEVVPGRAAILKLKWSERRTLVVLTVYAPNDARENEAFWNDLRLRRLGRVDMVLGDWNLVADQLDRLPMREDDSEAVNALREFRTHLLMVDGWRAENPGQRAFTYQQQATASQSRIDCVCVRRGIVHEAHDWAITEAGIPTDHKLTSVSIADYGAPFVGNGRWAMPDHLLDDVEVVKAMKDEGAKLCDAISRIGVRTEAVNVQLAYANFKTALAKRIRDRARVKVPKMKAKLDKLRGALEGVLNAVADAEDGDGNLNEQRQEEAAILQERITALERKCFHRRRDAVAMSHRLKSETISKQWIRTN
ncbi:DNase I-like protein, partial [Trametes sanguinea]